MGYLPHITVLSAIASIGAYSYLAIYVLTILSGHIIPLPEEILLLAVGYASGIGITDPWLSILAAIAGLLTGDCIMYAIGHHGGRLVEKFEHRLPQSYINKFSIRMNSRPVATIVGMRFISGVRIFSPLFAGAWRIPFKVYILADFGALCAYVSIYVGLGYFFNNALGTVIGGVAVMRHLVFLAILLLIGLFLAYHAYRIFFSSSSSE